MEAETGGEILLVPVFFALVQSWEHEGHNAGHIVTDQTQDVFVIPKIQRTLCNLWRREQNKHNGVTNITSRTTLTVKCRPCSYILK